MTFDGIMLLTSGVLMLQAEILLPQGEFVFACYQKMAKCKHIMYFGLILGCSEETGKELGKKKTKNSFNCKKKKYFQMMILFLEPPWFNFEYNALMYFF